MSGVALCEAGFEFDVWAHEATVRAKIMAKILYFMIPISSSDVCFSGLTREIRIPDRVVRILCREVRRTQIRRTVFREERHRKGSRPIVSVTVVGIDRSRCEPGTERSQSGFGFRLITGRDCAPSICCLAQQGCSCPQGISPKGIRLRDGKATGERPLGQQECWWAAAANVVALTRAPANERTTRASGTLHEVSEASTSAAMSFFCIRKPCCHSV